VYETYLFDLDMTLLDTSALLADRVAHRWDCVMGRLGEACAFPSTQPPHHLPGQLAASGAKVGVVTSSPRNYAVALMHLWKIHVDLVVAGNEAAAPKPSPAGIHRALQQLGAVPGTAVYIGDDPNDVQAAARAGVLSVGALWAPGLRMRPGVAADVQLFEPGLLLSLGEDLRLVGESTTQPRLHQGSAILLPKGIALGRRFKGEDLRAPNGRMTASIDVFKKGGGNGTEYASLVARGLAVLDYLEGWRPNYVVSVPPWPGKLNRFAALFQALALAYPCAHWLADGLQAVKDVSGYKGLNPQQRAAAIAGAFASTYSWSAEHRLLVVDDVHTTGATTAEAMRALAAGGASAANMRILALTKEQHPPVVDEASEPCPRCGVGILVQRPGRMGRFWGCSRFSKGCRYTRPL
jgi:Haloacid dehalogenase-like hydrolase